MVNEVRKTIVQYTTWMGKKGIYPRHFRFLLSSRGLLLLHTPVHKLPALLNLQAAHRILDLGCGRGSVLGYLRNAVPLEHYPVGIDVTRCLLQMGRSAFHRDSARASVLQVAQASGTHLPFRDGIFDVVISSYVVKHFNAADLEDLGREVHRVLRAGGQFALWEFAPAPWRPLTWLYRAVFSRTVTSEHLRSQPETAAILARSGFERVEPLPLGFFLYPPIGRITLLAAKRAG